MALQFNQQGIPAASGYPQYTGTALLPPTTSMTILNRYYATSVFSQIANTDFEGDLRKSGGTIYFMKQPRVTIRPYAKNGRIQYDTAEVETVPLTVGNAFQAGYKIDKLDHQLLGSTWDRLEKSLIKAVPEAMLRQIDYTIFAGLVNEIQSQNKGVNAGPNGLINLGDHGNPVALTAANIMEFLFRMSEVLTSAGIPHGQRFVVVPPQIASLVKLSPLGFANTAGTATSSQITGVIPTMLDGMTVIESPYLPSYADSVSGNQTFHIYAGTKEALTFATIVDNAEVIESDPFEYSRFVRVIGAYGWGVLYPEALAAGYVTVQ